MLADLFIKLALYLGVTAVGVVGGLVLLGMMWVRWRTKNRSLIIFCDQTKQLFFRLEKTEGVKSITSDVAEKRNKYVPLAEGRHLINYPISWPSFFQVKLAAYMFDTSIAEPRTILSSEEGDRPHLTPRMINEMIDEEVLAASFKDARESFKEQEGLMGENKLPQYTLMGVGIVGVLVCFVIYTIMKHGGQLTEILSAVRSLIS